MKPEVKKWVIVGVLGAVSVALALGYLQYKKLMNYVIKPKGVKFKTLSASLFNFDLYIDLTNNADIKYEILEQDYKVYMNDKFVTKLVNYAKVSVPKKGTVTMPINVQFNPKDVLNVLGQNFATILLKPQEITIKIDMKLKVAMFGIKVSIPYVYKATLKEMMTPAPAPKN